LSLSQTTTIDATLVPNGKLRDAAKLIEKGKICEQRVALLYEKITLLNQRIAYKDSIIKLHQVKDTAQLNIVATYKDEVKNLLEQKELLSKEMINQNKLLKRQKRKTTFGIAGTAGLAVGLFFLLK
jgi:Zn-dependent peptidase ImmA (M78 family)